MSPKTSTATRSKRTAEGRTDWERLRSMTEEEIEAAAASDPDNPATDREFWRDARTVHPDSPRWETIQLHIDVDVLQWFKARRFRHQDEIDAALRAYMEAHRDLWPSGLAAACSVGDGRRGEDGPMVRGALLKGAGRSSPARRTS